MSGARLIQAGHSAAFLPADGSLRRRPRAPDKPRPPEFHAAFEDRALVYDCFWHQDGKCILLVGPPPMNLEPQFATARFLALPARAPLSHRFYRSLSTMITELQAVPSGTTAITMELAGQTYELPVQPNHGAALAGRRLLFTMSKDNDLAWIREWTAWHATRQGADAVLLFDNGSSRYGLDEIEETLLGVGGIERVAVQRWPYRYGMTDPALGINPFYILFLQVSAMSVALRRFAPAAFGLLNCDVDELVASPPGATIFDHARASRHGLVVMRGRYVEAVPNPDAPASGRTHRHYRMRFADPRRALSRPRKWALDPSRPWVRRLAVHPYMHWIEGRPWFSKHTPPGTFYRHFRGINTNWKDRRTETAHIDLTGLVDDREFAELVAQHAF